MAKKSAIRDIFTGKRGDMDTMKHMPSQQDYDELDRLDLTIRQTFLPEQLELQQKWFEVWDRIHFDEIQFFFVEGFKLGVKIGIECAED